MIIGYARVASTEDELDRQIAALSAAGCQKIYSDCVVGAVQARPGLLEALAALNEGDTLVVFSLDRIGKTVRGLIRLVVHLVERRIMLKALHGQVASAEFCSLMVELSRVERVLVRERTNAALRVAKKKGRVGGRPSALGGDRREAAMQLLAGGQSVKAVAHVLGVSVSTVYRNCDDVAR